MTAAESGATGEAETSWFQAVWSAADGAFAGRFGFGNTWQAPREGYGPRGSLPPPFFFAATAKRARGGDDQRGRDRDGLPRRPHQAQWLARIRPSGSCSALTARRRSTVSASKASARSTGLSL